MTRILPIVFSAIALIVSVLSIVARFDDLLDLQKQVNGIIDIDEKQNDNQRLTMKAINGLTSLYEGLATPLHTEAGLARNGDPVTLAPGFLNGPNWSATAIITEYPGSWPIDPCGSPIWDGKGGVPSYCLGRDGPCTLDTAPISKKACAQGHW